MEKILIFCVSAVGGQMLVLHGFVAW